MMVLLYGQASQRHKIFHKAPLEMGMEIWLKYLKMQAESMDYSSVFIAHHGTEIRVYMDLEKPVKTKEVRFHLKAPVAVTLSEIGLYKVYL